MSPAESPPGSTSVPAPAPTVAPAPAGVVKSSRPGWLTLFAVGAIAVGAIQALSALSSAAAPRLLALQHQMMTGGKGDVDNPVVKAQAEAQRRMQEVLTSRKNLTLVAGTVGIVAAIGMILGGIGCLSFRRRARPLLVAAFALGLALELGTARQAISLQMDLTNANTDLITSAFKAGSGGQLEQAQRIVGTVAATASSIGIAMAIAFVIARVALYGGGIFYLLRGSVRQLFEAKNELVVPGAKTASLQQP